MNNIQSIYQDSIIADSYKRVKSKWNGQEFAEVLLEKDETKDNSSNNSKDTKSKTESSIIVKPDGTRVLIMTTRVGSIETSMSIELSKTNKWDDTKLNRVIKHREIKNVDINDLEINSTVINNTGVNNTEINNTGINNTGIDNLDVDNAKTNSIGNTMDIIV